MRAVVGRTVSVSNPTSGSIEFTMMLSAGRSAIVVVAASESAAGGLMSIRLCRAKLVSVSGDVVRERRSSGIGTAMSGAVSVASPVGVGSGGAPEDGIFDGSGGVRGGTGDVLHDGR